MILKYTYLLTPTHTTLPSLSLALPLSLVPPRPPSPPHPLPHRYRLKTANAFGTRKYEQQEDRFTVVPDLKAAMGDDFTKAVSGVGSGSDGKKGGKAAAKAAEKLKKKMEKKAKAGSDSDSDSSSSSSSSDSDSSSSSDGEPAECSLSTPLQEVVEWCCNDGKDGTLSYNGNICIWFIQAGFQ